MKIKSRVKDYSVEFVDDLLKKKEEIFRSLDYDKLVFFIDKNFHKLYEKQVERFIGKEKAVIIPATEHQKSYSKLSLYYRKLIEMQFTRKDILVTFGGGVLQDLSGFIASTLYRGIKWIFFPTTLLAQADSCIGSKTSINFDKSKNLIGSFYPPDKIFIDTSFCRTLTRADFNSGIGEIIKFHLMSDEKEYCRLLRYLSQDDLFENRYFNAIVKSTLKIKYSYFKGDEFDSGRRNLLNYGHCFGHALEAASNYAVAHGEAVLIGMGFANLLSLKRGIMSTSKYEEFERLISMYYPKFDWDLVSIDEILYHLKRDKKRVGKHFTMVLCKDVGKQFKCDDIKEKEIRSTYKEFVSKYEGKI